MPLPQDLNEFCVDLQVGPGEICVTVPGGTQLCASVSVDIPDPTDLVKQLFAEANAMLAPFVPIFNLIDFALAAFNCLKAIPKLAAIPPDPKPLLDCFPALAEKIDALLRLLPPTSIPLFVRELLDALLLLLVSIRSRLQLLIDQVDRIVEARTRAAAAGNVRLELLLDCAEANLEVQLSNLNKGLAPINRLLGIVNALLQLAGIDVCIPGITQIDEIAEEALEPLDKLIELIQFLRDAIPQIPSGSGAGARFAKACS